ncbi:MAG: glycosyltransferase family 2 protein [Spirochaetes bacterium]|nr:glycosyltransferase family 2 protein [Spirochaetota bacterium]
MNLSVIIPTRNRAVLLNNTLDSILYQTLPQNEFEVIVIDNGSKDDTNKVVDSFKTKISNLRYFFEEKPGLHVGRHRGLKEAQSDILVYADDDIEAFPNWLKTIKESFEDKDIALVGGKILPKWECEIPDWIAKMWNEKINLGQCLSYLSILDFGDKIMEIPPGYVFGCNYSVRKEILIKSKGFHPDGMPQELIKYRGDGESYVSRFVHTNNFKTLYNPDASVFHVITKERLTVEYFCKRAYNQGVSDSYLFLRNKYISERVKNISFNEDIKFVKKNIIKFLSFVLLKLKKDLIKQNIQKSYILGYRYHQKQYKNDDTIKKWVLKEDYL